MSTGDFGRWGRPFMLNARRFPLSRKPLFGTTAQVNQRAKDSLASTLRHTKERALEKMRAQSEMR